MSELKILIAGHSHIGSLMDAYEDHQGLDENVRFDFLSFRNEKYNRGVEPPALPASLKLDLLMPDFLALAQIADVAVLSLNGNEHNNLGLFEIPSTTFGETEARVRRRVSQTCSAWLKLLLENCSARVVLLLPPPPIESTDYILKSQMAARIGRPLKVRDAQDRLRLWQTQCEVISAVGHAFNLEVFSPPEDVFSSSGFLAEHCWRVGDATHGNMTYGKRVLQELIGYLVSTASENAAKKRTIDPRKHPYRYLPDHCFWKQSVSQLAAEAVDPVVDPAFKIRPSDKVATAGSCFAQHISKHLRAGGFRFLVTESAKEAEGKDGGVPFHDFSARYGNVYTARQLLQLFERAFGYFRPLERVWETTNGHFCDPFRPTIQPGGYPSKEAVFEDTRQHLAAVRKMFRQLDVFVFTLGLTECWTSRLDGAVYPMAPGVAGGEFDPDKHEFLNCGVNDVVSDMRLFIKKLRLVNPKAKIILTVSPVPLAATYENHHVLVSTTYSKSVLRVAAEELVSTNNDVYYFPSFEIITGSHAAGRYFEPDRRGVAAEGVSHVMKIFMARLTEKGLRDKRSDAEESVDAIEALGEAMCDEEMLSR